MNTQRSTGMRLPQWAHLRFFKVALYKFSHYYYYYYLLHIILYVCSALSQSLWSLMAKQVLTYTMTAPYTFLSGLILISELLPIPLPVQTNEVILLTSSSNSVYITYTYAAVNRNIASHSVHHLSSFTPHLNILLVLAKISCFVSSAVFSNL